ncbi:MAG: hypothetical protein J6N15_00865 [Ruminiclostridium sp.]|nr:hypothetical protein [Ruminiclostridium sp.]
MNTETVVIGGDMRMIYAGKRLAEHRSCSLAGFDGLGADQRAGLPLSGTGGRYDIAVLPIFAGNTREIRCPYANRTYDIGIIPLLVKPGGAVFTGRTFPELKALCETSGIELYDYLAREEFAVRNAVLTAEGTVETAIRETAGSIHGSKVLILGFGRIGKLCARYFSALGASVSAAARKKSDIAWIAAYDCTPVDFTDEKELKSALADAEIIVNTVPAQVLTGTRAEAVNPDALLIELASVPCTDSTSRIRTVNAGGLPGRTAPRAAGTVIADTIENILAERRMNNGGA